MYNCYTEKVVPVRTVRVLWLLAAEGFHQLLELLSRVRFRGDDPSAATACKHLSTKHACQARDEVGRVEDVPQAVIVLKQAITR